MNFTETFIRRPVLATVVSLMILVLGARALESLPILQYPRTQNTVVTVTTIYYGADPEVIAGFITTPLENAIAQANGIDYMSSSSLTSTSTITIYLRLNYDADKALTEINTKIQSVLNQLPAGTQQPQLVVKVGQTIDAMYLGFDSSVLPRNKRCLACRTPRSSARRISRFASGWIRLSSQHSASPGPTWQTRCSRTILSLG